MVNIDDIPVGSKFKVIESKSNYFSKEEIKKAERWWKSLPDEQKVKLYRDIQETIHGY